MNSYLDIVQIAVIVRIVIWQPNRFVHDLAPVFVILVAYHVSLTNHTAAHNNQQKTTTTHIHSITLLCHRTMANVPPIKPWEKTITSSSRRRRRGQASTPMCCRRRRPTGGGSPRSEGGSNAGRRRGDRCIAAALTAALAQLARLSTRGARAGAALAASYRRTSMPHAGPRWRHG